MGSDTIIRGGIENRKRQVEKLAAQWVDAVSRQDWKRSHELAKRVELQRAILETLLEQEGKFK